MSGSYDSKGRLVDPATGEVIDIKDALAARKVREAPVGAAANDGAPSQATPKDPEPEPEPNPVDAALAGLAAHIAKLKAQEAKGATPHAAHVLPDAGAVRKELIERYDLIVVLVGRKTKTADKIAIPQAVMANYMTLLRRHPHFKAPDGTPLLRRNIDNNRPMYGDEQLVENVSDMAIIEYFQRDLCFSGGAQTAQPASIRDAIKSVLASNEYSPFNDHVHRQAARLRAAGPEAIAQANAKLNRWAVECMGAPNNEWSERWGRKYIIMGVMRAMRPGCHMRVGFALVGQPNIGKTPMPKVWWGDDNVKIVTEGNVGGKELAILTASVLCVVFDEGNGIKRLGAEGFKGFVSQQEDDFRMPYAARETRHKRRSHVYVPVNDPKFLHHDHTGNTKMAVLNLREHRARGHVFEFKLMEAWRDDVLGAALIAIEGGEDQATFEGVEESAKEHEMSDAVADVLASAIGSRRMASSLKVGVYKGTPIAGLMLTDLMGVMQDIGGWSMGLGGGGAPAVRLSEILRESGWTHAGQSAEPLGIKRLWWMPLAEFDGKYTMERVPKGDADLLPERPEGSGNWRVGG
ncbi:VapE domain-containing protein [Variovorax sp. J31P179]|uniref:VapE domain-containing protein n=1 Tax=Variovorax sp. J31P179 TaxID=3053508 RepID=UPI002574A672|nr:VapE domain-containing protein [Variovorax sp. J31P179]